MNFLAARNSTSAVAPEPSSSVTISPACAAGGPWCPRPRVQATDSPTSPASTPRSASDQRLERLLLRGHDALERRVARLAGLVGHRQHQRQRAARSTSVATSPSRWIRTWSPCDLDLRAERDAAGSAEPLGQHRRHDAHRAVGRGHAAHHQVVGVGPIFLIGLGEHQRGGDRVGAGDRVVDDVDALVGAHLQRLADRVDGLLGADASARSPSTSSASSAFSLIWSACSTAYSSSSESRPSTPTRSTVLSSSKCRSRGGVRHVLHTDNNVHGCHRPGKGPSCAVGWTRGYPRVATRGTGPGVESVTWRCAWCGVAWGGWRLAWRIVWALARPSGGVYVTYSFSHLLSDQDVGIPTHTNKNGLRYRIEDGLPHSAFRPQPLPSHMFSRSCSRWPK